MLIDIAFFHMGVFPSAYTAGVAFINNDLVLRCTKIVCFINSYYCYI